MTNSDPLETADIGETVTVETTQEMWLGDLADRDRTAGSDRFAEHDVQNIEVYEDEYGEQILRVTLESDVTKRLPHRWGHCQEPRTEQEVRQERKWRWLKRAAHSVSVGIPIVVATAISVQVTQLLGESFTINGEPVVMPAVTESAGIVAAVMLVAFLITMLVTRGGRPWFRGGGLA